jgi:tRNA A37 threonylcarbamoyladenosine dehydratase
VDLAVAAAALRLPMISCMGAGNKLDPTRFEVTDLARTRVCPLSRVMRRELKKHGILHLKVVYSPEEPVQALTPAEADPLADVVGEDDVSQGASFVRRVPGSIAYVPSVAGLILAGEVIRDLLQAAASDSPSGPGDGAGSDR